MSNLYQEKNETTIFFQDHQLFIDCIDDALTCKRAFVN